MRNILDDMLEGLGINLDLVGIYHLKSNGVVVYVGQTKNIRNRIAQHLYNSDKEFDDIDFFEVDDELLNDAEAREIVHFKPKYNKLLPSSSLYINEKELLSQVEKLVKKSLKPIIKYKTAKCGLKPSQNYYLSKDSQELISSISYSVSEFIKAGE